MGDYKPPFDITNSMLMHICSISEKLAIINIKSNLERELHLRKNNKIKSIHSSLKIEANSLSLGQVRDVINGKPVIGKGKEIQEVKNAYAAYEQIKAIDPYSIPKLKELHGVMTKYTAVQSGQFRTVEEGVFDGDKCIFLAPSPQFVPKHMDDLLDWMKNNKDEIHPLILSAVFHYEFVFIHPFVDGNGRMARLWHTVLLTKWKSIFEYIPLESQIEKFQEQYYKAISDCHREGKSNKFIEFILEQIDAILDEFAGQISEVQLQESIFIKRILEVMEYDISYSATDIMNELGIKSKETFRKNYLNPAMELGLVEMTIPDKPRSKNQRYIKR